jgi:hypothetical protein
LYAAFQLADALNELADQSWKIGLPPPPNIMELLAYRPGSSDNYGLAKFDVSVRRLASMSFEIVPQTTDSASEKA